VIEHLRRYAQYGGVLDAEQLLIDAETTPEEQAAVFEAFSELGVFALGPVFRALEERVTYEELHRLRLYVELTATGRKDL
jgi:hypothetical protein